MSTLCPTHDDGPKLREELNYQEFYPTLDKEDTLPIYSNNEIQLSSDELRLHKDLNISRPKTKQIICNGKITTEPLLVDNKTSDYKPIKIPVEKLNLQLNHRNRPGPKRKYKDLKQNDIYESNAYLTKLGDTSLIQSRNLYRPDISNENQIDRDDERYNEIIEIERLHEALKKIVPDFQFLKSYYDMDEQDALYLRYLSETYSNIKLTALQFEYIFTILELKFTILQSQIPTNPPPPATIDQLCSICDEVETTNNTIVFCDSCNIAVHQECYGIIFIPPGPWLCRSCQQGNFDTLKPHCTVCPQLGGALKQTTTGNWVHVLCTVWIRELYFGNWHYLEPIEGLEKIPKSRWKLVCYICKQRNGACVQCSAKNCFIAYHVTCAKRLKCFMTPLKTGILAEMSLGNEHNLISYCHKHTPNMDHSGLNDTINLIRKEYAHNKELKNNKHLIRETIEIPQHFNNIICKCITAVTNSKNYILNRRVGDDICKYWSLKREHNKGAPIMDISNDIIKYPYNLIELSEIDDRLTYLDVFEQDLRKIEGIIDLIAKRSDTQINLLEAEEKIHDIIVNTELYLLKSKIFEVFIRDDAFKAIRRGITDEITSKMVNRLIHYEFVNIDQFNGFFKDFFDHLENLKGLPRTISSHFVKLKQLLTDLTEGIKFIDARKLLFRDFKIDENDLSVLEEREWIGPVLMEEDELSEVEDLTVLEKRTLDKILKRIENDSEKDNERYENTSNVDNITGSPTKKRKMKRRGNGKVIKQTVQNNGASVSIVYHANKPIAKSKKAQNLGQRKSTRANTVEKSIESVSVKLNANSNSKVNKNIIPIKIRKKPGPKPGTKIGKNGKPRKKPGPKPGTKIGLNGLPRKKPGPKPRLHKLGKPDPKTTKTTKNSKIGTTASFTARSSLNASPHSKSAMKLKPRTRTASNPQTRSS